MSQFAPPTNLLLACLAAIGLVPALGAPWYAHRQTAPSASGTEGAMEALAADLAAVFTSSGDTLTGAEALGAAETLLLGIAAATVLLALSMLVPVVRDLARGPLRIVPLAAPAVVLLQVLDQPGANAAVDLRWGVFAGLALTLLMAAAAAQGAELSAARAAPRAYTPPTYGS